MFLLRDAPRGGAEQEEQLATMKNPRCRGSGAGGRRRTSPNNGLLDLPTPKPTEHQRIGTLAKNRGRRPSREKGRLDLLGLGHEKPRGGRRSRDKGNRAERALIRFLQDHGFAAERVPLSGAAGGRFGGDVTVPLLGIDRRVEVKSRGKGFQQLCRWLDGASLLVVRADRRNTLVVLPLRFAIEIAQAAERSRAAVS